MKAYNKIKLSTLAKKIGCTEIVIEEMLIYLIRANKINGKLNML